MQPPASLEALGDPIYEAFYGLSEQPFAITTDPRFFYLSASHQRAYSELLNGLRRYESLLLLTGDTGTGKTTLCRTVLASLGDRTFSALILNPYMSGPEVLRIVLRDFGFVSHEDLRRGVLASADVPQLLDTLEGFLRSIQPLATHAVIVIDEAQALAPAILDQIRLLTALEHDRRRLVQVILCGQPGLVQTIKSDSLHALNERITRRVELTPLQAEDVQGYIQHRLAVAGAGDNVRFDDTATRAVAELSRGLPRRINVICDRALQEGRIEGAHVITQELVKRAARALAGVHEPAPAVAPAPPVAPRAVPVALARQEPEPTPAPIYVRAPVAPESPAARTQAAAAAVAMPVPVPPTPAPPPNAWIAATPPPAPIEAPAPVMADVDADPLAAVFEQRPIRDLPDLSFGQTAEEPPKRAWKTGLVAAAVVAALGASGYSAWVLSVGTPERIVPQAPRVSILARGALPAKVSMPSIEEMNEMMIRTTFLRRAPRPAVAEPSFGGGSVWSGQ